MKSRLALMTCLMAIVMLGLAQVAAHAKGDTKKKVEVSSTQQIEFAPGGIVRIQQSYGEVLVEGWDKNVVEVTVIKTIDAKDNPQDQEKARLKLDGVKVTVAREAKNGLLISSTFASRKGVNLVYKIKIPQQSDLFVKHTYGGVSVANVVGDMELTARIGGIDVDLLSSYQYDIDAKSKIGGVESAFEGKSKRKFLVSETFTGDPKHEAHRIYLRVGIGGIGISKNIGKVVEQPTQ
jgi:hypothetical protein